MEEQFRPKEGVWERQRGPCRTMLRAG